MPVLVLLLLERGLSPGQVALCLAVQAVVVLFVELPTGSTADSRGRRQVHLAASAVDAASIALLAVADSLPLIVGVFVLQGFSRALESGPLDARYVDSAHALDPDTDIDAAMAASGTVVGLSIAAGSVTSSALVALDAVPTINPFLAPVSLAVVIRIADLAAIATLMSEPARPRTDTPPTALQVISLSISTIRHSRALLALLTIEGLWGVGIVAFETFTPPRLESTVAEPTDAAAMLGPATAAAWLLAGLAAATVPTLTRRYGAERVGAGLLLCQGATVAGIALLIGPIGILAAYLATMAVHGAANPIHQTLLHRAITDPAQRTTVLSANSLTGNLGAAIGAIALGTIADTTTLSIAILTGAAILATAAPLYLRTTPTHDQRHAPAPRLAGGPSVRE